MSLMQNRVDTKRMRFHPSQVTSRQWVFWWSQFLKRKGNQAAAGIVHEYSRMLPKNGKAGLTTPSEDCYCTFLGCSQGEQGSDF